MDENVKRGLGVRFNGSYSTISIHHEIDVFFNGVWKGSTDNAFFYGVNNFDWMHCIWLSSPVVLLQQHAMLVGPDGMIDADINSSANEQQRPALNY